MKNTVNTIWAPARYEYNDGTMLDFGDGYEVSNDGQLRKLKSDGTYHYYTSLRKNSHTSPDANGDNNYMRVTITLDKPRTLMVHRLVLSSFSTESGKGMTVEHKNGVRYDNRLDNLEWCSHVENCRKGTERRKRAHNALLELEGYNE